MNNLSFGSLNETHLFEKRSESKQQGLKKNKTMNISVSVNHNKSRGEEYVTVPKSLLDKLK